VIPLYKLLRRKSDFALHDQHEFQLPPLGEDRDGGKMAAIIMTGVGKHETGHPKF
jgi:hypothetical protein